VIWVTMGCEMKTLTTINLLALLAVLGHGQVLFQGGANLQAKTNSVADIIAKPTGLTGTFIQYQGWMMKNRRHPNNPQGLTQDIWKKELEAMQRAKIDTIIIQRLEGDGESFIPDADDREAVDPTDVILSYADTHAMRVYVGLWLGQWPDAKVISADPDLLKNTKNDDIRVAGVAWARYGNGKHNSLVGWYIPQEIWNINWDLDANKRVRTFFREVSEYCKGMDDSKRISNRLPVAISPFFSPYGSATTEEVVTSVYVAFLKGDEEVKGAGVDLVILQDGVGARCKNSEYEITSFVQPYFRAFLKAITEASKVQKVALWGNIESYKTVQGGCIDNYQKRLVLEPTVFSRLSLQLRAASLDPDNNQPFFEKVVTWDFFHYMSPMHPGSTLGARQELYSAYVDSYAQAKTKSARH